MIWLLISVVLLIVLIFFRIDILLVAPIVSVFLCLVSGLDVVDTLAEGFMPAFATFAKNNFLEKQLPDIHDQRNVCSCHAGHRYGGLDRSRHF